MSERAVTEVMKEAAQAQQSGRLAEAEALYRRLLALKPDHAPAQYGLGMLLNRLGRMEEAVACYREILKVRPDTAEVHLALGSSYDRLGRLEEARDHFEQGVRLKPELAAGHYALGSVLGRQDRITEAIGHFREAVRLEPGNAEAWYQLGYALSLKGGLEEAISCCERAIALRPTYAEAYNTLGVTLFSQGEVEKAVASYQQALAHRPGYVKAAYNLGVALARLGRWEAACEALESTLAHQPDFAEAQVELGLVYCRLGRRAEAVNCFNKAIALKPDHAPAYYKLGTIQLQDSNWVEAESSLRRALMLKPDFAEVHSNLGLVLSKLDRSAEAMGHFRKAIELKPDFIVGWNNMGTVLLGQGQLTDALTLFRKVIELSADQRSQPQDSISWADDPVNLEVHAYDAEVFVPLYLSSTTPEQVVSTCRRYAQRFEEPLRSSWPVHGNAGDPERRLKIGYVSPDLWLHSVAFFIEPILEHHDRRVVEVYCYYNNTVQDEVAQRLQSHADHWIPCVDLSDDELAARIRADGIDVLVDLAGHTGANRLMVFAHKPAPVQVSYLGYPATTGLKAMDWRLVTAATDPEGAEQWHSERLYRLPRSLWCYRPPEAAGEVRGQTPARAAGHITFGSMNSILKVSDEAVAVWSDILKRVPDSQLVMTGLTDGAQRRMRERFKNEGIGGERLQLHSRMGRGEFHGVLGTIDLALDTFPYAGTTTTCETLWLGVPVIALQGETSVSRSGYALLKTLELEELIARDEAEYVQKAVDLAEDLARLDALRGGMRARMEASPLRDEAGFTREIEAAYRAMWADWCRGKGQR